MTTLVHNGKNPHILLIQPKIKFVRKLMEQGAVYFLIYLWELAWILENTFKESIELGDQLSPQPWALAFVPASRVLDIDSASGWKTRRRFIVGTWGHPAFAEAPL